MTALTETAETIIEIDKDGNVGEPFIENKAETAEQHWLTAARKGCDSCGLSAPDEGVKTWREEHCWRKDEHQRTATLLQEQVEPLKAELAERESDLEALGGQAHAINVANGELEAQVGPLVEALRRLEWSGNWHCGLCQGWKRKEGHGPDCFYRSPAWLAVALHARGPADAD